MPNGHAWYVIHTYSGHEDRVKASLEKTIENLGLQAKIHKILIPTEEVMEIKRNRKQVKKRKFFPGYVMVDMQVDNETYWTIRNTTGVTGFLGGTQPIALPESEIKNLLDVATSAPATKQRPAGTFSMEAGMRIIDGAIR